MHCRNDWAPALLARSHRILHDAAQAAALASADQPAPHAASHACDAPAAQLSSKCPQNNKTTNSTQASFKPSLPAAQR